MKKFINIIIAITLLFFASCEDNIKDSEKEEAKKPNSFQIKFTLAAASDTIKGVTGLLESSQHDDISFDFDISNGTASKKFDHIQAGSWSLTIKAYSTSAKNPADLRYSGSQSFTIIAGEQTNINIKLNPTTGGLDIAVAWGSAASLGLNINQSSAPATLDHYYYTLTRSGFSSINGKINKSASITVLNKEIHDIKDGIWTLSLEARNSANSPLSSASGNFELQNGFILNVSANHNGSQIALNSSYNTQSGAADKIYIADEAFRKYLILARNFTDLREPYVLKSEVLAIDYLNLEFNQQYVQYYGEYALNRLKKGDKMLAYFDASVLKEFINLKELHLNGWILKDLTLLNNVALEYLSLKNLAADHMDLTGANNLKTITLQSVETYWIDAGQSNNLVDVAIVSNRYLNKDRGNSYPIGSIYIPSSLISSNFVQNSSYKGFISQAMDDTTSGKIVADEMTRKVFLHNGLSILKGYKFISSEANSQQRIYYGERINSNYGEGGGPQGYLNYIPLNSTSFLSHLPKLRYLTLYGAKITSIDLSNSPDLYSLYIGEANYLTSIDLSQTDTIYDLDIIGNAMLQSINFGTQKYNHSNFTIRYNHLLTRLDLRNVRKLRYLYANNNYGLSTVNLDSLNQLYYAYMYNCNINKLTMANNTSLYRFEVNNNKLTSVDLSSAVISNTLNFNNNDLTGNLDISKIGSFRYAYFSNNMKLDTIFKSHSQNGTIVKPDSTIIHIIDPPQ